MRKIALFALIQLIFLSACGGGGSGNFNLGGPSGSGGGQTIAGPAANVVTLTVDAGPDPSHLAVFNVPYVKVTICAPGSTTNCQTIDNIEVDTGSYGLRIISSVLNPTLLAALPLEIAAGFGDPIAECTMFGDGYSWGSMRTADVQISSEKAAGIPMQVIGDPNFPSIPTTCSSSVTRVQEDTVDTFGANGILGVGPFVQDCGDACVSSTQPGLYYRCPTGAACVPVPITLAQETTNPVAAFTTDNNGVIVELPAVQDAGALSVTGALVFGIGTQGNNSLGNATVLTTDPAFGHISVDFNGNTYPDSFIDSGSNLLYFSYPSGSANALQQCPLNPQSQTNNPPFYCPSSEQTLSATNIGTNNTQSNVTFKVGNAKTLFTNQPTYTAFSNVAAPNGGDTQMFDFGLPFFFGRNVFTAIDGQNTSGGMGPYFAY